MNNIEILYKPGDVVAIKKDFCEKFDTNRFLIVSISETKYFAYPVYTTAKPWYKPYHYLKVCQHTYHTETTNIYHYYFCQKYVILDPLEIEEMVHEITFAEMDEVEKRIKFCEALVKSDKPYPKFDRPTTYSVGDVILYKRNEWLVVDSYGAQLSCILIKNEPGMFSMPVAIKDSGKYAIYNKKIEIPSNLVAKLLWIMDEFAVNKIKAERVSKKGAILELEKKEAGLKLKDNFENVIWTYPIGTILEDVNQDKYMYIVTANGGIHYLLDVKSYDRGKINIVCRYTLDEYKYSDRIMSQFYLDVLQHLANKENSRGRTTFNFLIKQAEKEVERAIKASLPRRKLSERNLKKRKDDRDCCSKNGGNIA